MLNESRKRSEGLQKPLKTTRGWPPKRRREQAARIRRQKPWRFSTGPRTLTGKSRARFNAMKHGDRRYMYREFRRVLAKHRRFLRNIKQNKLVLPRYPAGFEELLLRHPREREYPRNSQFGKQNDW